VLGEARNEVLITPHKPAPSLLGGDNFGHVFPS
jgi:hypothetical protein